MKSTAIREGIVASLQLRLYNCMRLMVVFLQWTIRMLGGAQAQMCSVGQLVYYGNEIPEEVPETKP
ncbi:hypothetical protein CONCODRAFT_9159 [Conidiobolus coronatus NRRL 28638]|uniref:Uncharacterized protein n=1 Tax=Conidiobolus coronatus (strain ATCC 28846 / CBS 209.66 / NRRL 28638) TaxID=796925 RepID=A0A137P0F9_CONC2|nr:hypothetical protein CONCODRAFT_9159 [Conidiobolus coronatus NRRL 28638]|eukprot:KXN68563.1 hypothetical protein CONCODRAFT_9159 [Conidiobolus coronatus NRRL 28638]